MQSLIAFGVRMLESLFVIGLTGATLVLITTAIEDMEILLGRSSDEAEH